jgi:hypothetical protein
LGRDLIGQVNGDSTVQKNNKNKGINKAKMMVFEKEKDKITLRKVFSPLLPILMKWKTMTAFILKFIQKYLMSIIHTGTIEGTKVEISVGFWKYQVAKLTAAEGQVRTAWSLSDLLRNTEKSPIPCILDQWEATHEKFPLL